MGLPDSSCLLTKYLTLYHLFHPFCCNLAHCPQIRDLMPNLLPPQPSQPSTSLLCALEPHLKPRSWHLISSLEGAAYLKGGYNGSESVAFIQGYQLIFFASHSLTVLQHVPSSFLFFNCSYFSILFLSLLYYFIYIYLILHPFMLFVALDVFLLPC